MHLCPSATGILKFRATLQSSGGPQAPYVKICHAFLSWSWTSELSPPQVSLSHGTNHRAQATCVAAKIQKDQCWSDASPASKSLVQFIFSKSRMDQTSLQPLSEHGLMWSILGNTLITTARRKWFPINLCSDRVRWKTRQNWACLKKAKCAISKFICSSNLNLWEKKYGSKFHGSSKLSPQIVQSWGTIPLWNREKNGAKSSKIGIANDASLWMELQLRGWSR